jgi:magnesium transporter
VGEMDSDDATDIVGELKDDVVFDVLERMTAEDSTEVKELLTYDENTAGGTMQRNLLMLKKPIQLSKASWKLKTKPAKMNIFIMCG